MAEAPTVSGGPTVTAHEAPKPAGTTWTGSTPAPTETPAPAVSPTRADFDALAGKIVDLAASGDGIEAGFKTTEFWLTVIAVAVDVSAPYIGLNLSDSERMLIAAGLVSAYGAFRSWRKRGGPAVAYGDLLHGIANLRRALSGN